MKKIILIVTILLFTFVGYGCGSKTSNDKAEKDKNNRYLTIINETEQVINEVHVSVGEGTEIEAAYRENPDKKSFPIELPKEYKDYTEFKVTLIDRYELKYEKTVTDVKEKGRTEVKFTEEDYIKQDGDLKKKVNKFFNGD